MGLQRSLAGGFLTLLCLFWAGTLRETEVGALPQSEIERVRFAVATWNIRSGHGATSGSAGAPFDMNSTNCTDALRQRNAWGTGLVQRFLDADVARDADVVALAVQEAWGACGNVRNIATRLGWPAASPERGGVGLIARHGIVGAWDTWQLEIRNVGATEDRWIVGANVCLSPDCTSTVYMTSTHLSPIDDAEWPRHVGRALDWLERAPRPRLLMGDLNLWRMDRWSPVTRCGSPTLAMALALDRIAAAGYVDAWSATQEGEGWTATIPRAGCGAEGTGGPFKRIDYIWSQGLQPLSSTRIGVVAAGEPAPSDHFGVKASLSIPVRVDLMPPDQ